MVAWADVVINDRAERELFERMVKLKKLKLRVGYQFEEGKAIHPGSEVTVAKLAAILEFGSPEQGIPERSFIRSTIDDRQHEISGELEKQIERVVLGKQDPVGAYSEVGKLTVKLIRGKLLSAGSWADPLDIETVRQKGHGRPLYRRGVLAEALSWRVSQGRQTLARGK